MTKSCITGGAVSPLFTAKILGKYDVVYSRCDQTGFVQTEEPYWLQEAYSSAITALDIGLIGRNIENANLTQNWIPRINPSANSFVDYGGGYGVFVRLMRDAGYPFLLYDEHCENLFAKGFATNSLISAKDGEFDFLTAWEVFEHLASPTKSIRELCRVAHQVLFSTILIPDTEIRSASDWWYFTPETGQHVAFYSRRSLEFLAKSFGVYFYTDGKSNHLFSRIPLSVDPFLESGLKSLRKRFLSFMTCGSQANLAKPSLRQHDYEKALQSLRSNFDARGPQ